MEIFGEFFLTASLALFLSFLVAKVVAAALVVGDSNSKSVTAEDSGEGFTEALRCQSSEAEKKVEFVDEVVEKVDRLREEVAEEVSVERSEITDDLTSGGSAESAAANDGVSSEPDEARAEIGESEARLRDEASEAGSRSSDGDEDSDWEGIERDERESDFAAAVKFVENRFSAADDDLQAELYGLRKVAMEGACREAMPEEALELSDLRVKWLAWQKLGDMPREVAMERYITLLSHNVPAWTEDHHSAERKSEFLEGETTVHSVAPAFSTNERESDGKSNVKGVDISGVAVLKT